MGCGASKSAPAAVVEEKQKETKQEEPASPTQAQSRNTTRDSNKGRIAAKEAPASENAATEPPPVKEEGPVVEIFAVPPSSRFEPNFGPSQEPPPTTTLPLGPSQPPPTATLPLPPIEENRHDSVLENTKLVTMSPPQGERKSIQLSAGRTPTRRQPPRERKPPARQRMDSPPKSREERKQSLRSPVATSPSPIDVSKPTVGRFTEPPLEAEAKPAVDGFAKQVMEPPLEVAKSPVDRFSEQVMEPTSPPVGRFAGHIMGPPLESPVSEPETIEAPPPVAKGKVEEVVENAEDIQQPPPTYVEVEEKIVPLSFPQIFEEMKENSALKSTCRKLRKKLNHDPWDEYSRYDDEAMSDFISAHPDCCKVRYEFDSFAGQIFPLSVLCALGASRDTIELAHQAYPEAITDSTILVGTPLHYACSYKAPLEVIEYLIEKQPESLEATNHFKRTPLHMACLFKAEAQIISLLVQQFQQATGMQDKDGYSPLHLACENGATPDIIDILMTANSESVYLVTLKEETALHLASSNNAPKAVVQILLDAHAYAANQADLQGQTPLHVAAQGNASAAVIQLLIAAAENGLDALTDRGETPLRIAKRKDAPDHILELLQGT